MGFLDPKPVTTAGLDAATAAKINAPGSATATALNATIDTKVVAERATTATSIETRVVTERATTAAAIDDRRFNGLLKGLIPVADGCGTFAVSSKSNGTNTVGYTRSIHKVMVDAYDFRLVYVNFQHGEAGDNAITVTAKMEPLSANATPANPTVLYPVTFDGQPSVTLAPWGLAISDPIPFNATTGQYLVPRTQVNVAAGGKWPYGRVLNPRVTGSEGRIEGTTETPGYMAAAAPTAIAGVYANAYVPYMIVATPSFVGGVSPSPKSVYGAGDSILHGLGTLPIAGWFGDAVRELTGWTYFAGCATGEITPGFLAPNPRLQLLDSRWDYVLHEYGSNECAALNLSDTKFNIIAGWRAEQARGLKVLANTVSPRTTSTDGWNTTTNQTPDSAHNGVRVPYNQWLRDGAPLNASTFAAVAIGGSGVRIGEAGHPVVALFDLAAAVESGTDTGLWKARQGRAFTATTTTNGGVVNSPDAVFTSADLNETIWIDNAGTAGADHFATITNIRNATQVDVIGITPTATTSVSGSIGVVTSDGIHMTDTSTRLIKTAFKTFLQSL